MFQDHGSPGLAGVIIAALVLGPLIAAWGVRERWLPLLGRCVSEPLKWLGLLIAHITYPPLLYGLGESAYGGGWLQVPCPLHKLRSCTACSLNCQVSSGLIACGLLAGIVVAFKDRWSPGALAFYAWIGSALAITFIRGLLQRFSEARGAARQAAEAPPAEPAPAVPAESVPATASPPEPIIQPIGGAMNCPCDAQWAWGSRDGRQCGSLYSARRCTRPEGHTGLHHSHDERGICKSVWHPELTLQDRFDAAWEGAGAFLQEFGRWLLQTAGYVLFPPLLCRVWGNATHDLKCVRHRTFCLPCILSWLAGLAGLFTLLGFFAERADRVGVFGEGQLPFLAWLAVMLIGSPYTIIRERMRRKARKAGLALACPVDAQRTDWMRERWATQCGQPAIGGIGRVCIRKRHHAGLHHTHDAQGGCITWGFDEDGFAWPLRLIGHAIYPPSILWKLEEGEGCTNHGLPACSHCLSARYFGFLAGMSALVACWTYVLQSGRAAWSSDHGEAIGAAGPLLAFWSFCLAFSFIAWLGDRNDRRILARERDRYRPARADAEPQAAEFIEPEAVLPPRPEPEQAPAAAQPPVEAVEAPLTEDPPLPPEPVPEQQKPHAALLEQIQAMPLEEATQERLEEFRSRITAFEQEHGEVPELHEALVGLEQMANAARQ
jgi:hypothetical protein